MKCFNGWNRGQVQLWWDIAYFGRSNMLPRPLDTSRLYQPVLIHPPRPTILNHILKLKYGRYSPFEASKKIRLDNHEISYEHLDIGVAAEMVAFAKKFAYVADTGMAQVGSCYGIVAF